MIKRPTIILLIILIFVVGAFLFTKYHPLQSSQATPTSTGSQFLITSSDGTLMRVSIQDNNGNLVEMQRDPSQTWIIIQPELGSADQSKASAAETQAGALRIISELTTPPELSEMGLDSPALTIALDFNSGIHHQISVGNLTPTSNGYYVQFDGQKIFVVSQSGIESLRNLLTNPPYQPTATLTATPSFESTITPKETETSQPTP
jgi:hypothetical protein